LASTILPPYKDSDDALHPYDNPEYYEWWYFDARFDNGYSCVATFHWRNPFTSPHIPTIQVFIYAPDGKKYIGMAAIPLEQCSSNPERCDVEMGGNFARQEGNSYVISMRAKNYGVDLTYNREIPGWKQNGDGLLYNEGDKKQGWIIAAPRSQVEGTLYIEGSKVPVSGIGYHDKNWGNCRIDTCFRSWYWGRLHDPVYTLIFYRLLPIDTNHQHISGLLLAKNNQPVLATNLFNLSVEKEMLCKTTGKNIPAKIVVSNIEGSGPYFNCELVSTSTVETDRLPKLSDLDQYHWRFLGDYNLNVDLSDGQHNARGKSIHEHLVFR